ncbi:MAG: metallophosphoesterase family protein [Chloroflexota bacterium]|nr:metallophosphoesterase family protein [Chloroflexota bacterium]
MKVAVISDIHGFSLALASVLDAIGREPDIDMIVAAGDLCEGGPDPRGALHVLKERSVRLLRGNTDRDIVEGMRTSRSAAWVVEELGNEGLEQLATLPFDLRVQPPGGRPLDDDLLIVHANPFDEYQQLPPSASDAELREILGDTRAAVIAFGHIHIAYRRTIDEFQLIDVSAVGNPKDEDFRSKWGLCTWHEETAAWTTELRYVPYPLEETLAQMEASGMPNWSKAAAKLQRASYQEQ